MESISEDIVNTCQLSLPVFPLSSVVKEFNADFMLIILLYAKVSVIIEINTAINIVLEYTILFVIIF